MVVLIHAAHVGAARRAADRRRDEAVGEGDSLVAYELLQLGHGLHAVELPVLVVRQDHDQIGLLGRRSGKSGGGKLVVGVGGGVG